MEKKQSILGKLDNPYIFITITIVMITIMFLIFSPHISSFIFPSKKEATFNSYLNQTKSENRIDPRKFWEFREFYSPGYFKFSDKGINQSETNATLNDFRLNPQNIDFYFSKFESKNLESLDGLTTSTTLDRLINENDLHIKNVLFKNENTVIYKNNNNQTFIIFLLPVSEMSKANGFFDYNDKDKKLLIGKNWIDITRLNN